MTLLPSCLGPNACIHTTIPHHAFRHLLGLLLSGLAGLGASELGRRGALLGSLGSTNGADAGNGIGTEVGAVVELGGAAGNTLVGPICRKNRSVFQCSRYAQRSSFFHAEYIPPTGGSIAEPYLRLVVVLE